MNIAVTELRAPQLEFGDNKGYFSDPRVGLTEAGPFSLRFEKAHKSMLRVGLLGTQTLLKDARAWYRRCSREIVTGKVSSPMYIDFPGFERVFQSAIVLDHQFEEKIDKQLEQALSVRASERFTGVLDVYSEAINRLRAGNNLDIIVCCLPNEVITNCWHMKRSLSRLERIELNRRRGGDQSQMSFEQIWGGNDTAEELLERDFRRALKARAMKARIPIQIATSSLFLDPYANQDPATRAWNSSVALFYKAGGIPWRVKSDGPETCFVGISFHYLRTTRNDLMYSSIAQAFSSEGEGFALKGDSVERSEEQTRNPHLSDQQAKQLGAKVIAEYRERTGKDPTRIVLHKTTQFSDGERRGFSEALSHIPVIEFVNLGPSDFRLVQRTAYPPKRGTLCRVNDDATYLFTTGYIPEWHTYPGMHIPVPTKIITDQDTDILRTATDVLALGRMNWNTAFDTTGAPITLRFARQVGGIMAEVGKETPDPSYRYYM
jgi:hypothetical protein